jgi:formylmethanofuran dehydrogenase subunit E
MSENDETPILDNEPVYEVDCDNCGKTMMTNNKNDINLCIHCRDEYLTPLIEDDE